MSNTIIRGLIPCAALVASLAAACGSTPCPTPPAQPCGGICASNQVCVEDVCKYTCTTNLDCERIDARIGYCSPDHLCDPPPSN
jgi:hypothetical protein